MGANAQRTCNTADYLAAQLAKDPSLKAAYTAAEQKVNEVLQLSMASRDTAANEIITIPVVVHVLYKTAQQNISEAQIRSQLDVLNRDYRRMNTDTANAPAVFKQLSADSRIMFCLAQVDPTGHSTKGIIRKYTNNDFFQADDGAKMAAMGGDKAWDCKKYLNIWICNLGSRLLGYASLPGGPADKDGVVINYDVFGTTGYLRPVFNKGRTTTHEVGHWLGLKHTWGDAECGDDGVDDTPRQKSYNYGCPSFPHTTACSANGNGDLFMNFMDFTDDGCMNMFTVGQARRMRALFAKDAARNSFLTSFACDSTLATGGPVGEPEADQVKIFPNPTADIIHINSKTTATLAGKKISVFNMMGVKVISQELLSNSNTISLKHLPTGVYLLRVDTDEKITLKIVRL